MASDWAMVKITRKILEKSSKLFDFVNLHWFFACLIVIVGRKSGADESSIDFSHDDNY